VCLWQRQNKKSVPKFVFPASASQSKMMESNLLFLFLSLLPTFIVWLSYAVANQISQFKYSRSITISNEELFSSSIWPCQFWNKPPSKSKKKTRQQAGRILKRHGGRSKMLNSVLFLSIVAGSLAIPNKSAKCDILSSPNS
jgi:hypothetical protein